MEGKWFEAGCSGNIVFLHDAVRGDGAILQKLHSWGTTDTPDATCDLIDAPLREPPRRGAWVEVHGLVPTDGAIDATCDLIDALLREVLSALAPYEPHGPLHLALANGHLEIVQFLLEFGKHKFAVKELCMKKDRDGRTALHSAVVTGKISVIDLLFDHCPDATKEVTIHQESVLHLAVKHHQQEVLEFLID
ncbi:hypothetical protein Sango_2331600 [Sesamum angolense]|uniref:Uncharacterized protein n=1 Tax=Sesamum angolense TaxID=2727404 RepID=A0AAE2BLM2_9LAMI|nr:hypothetical protein Sango_2331600 [Sesamum angolense]